MNKVKILSIISIVLMVFNIILIWFLVTSKPNRPHRGGPKKIIIEKLHFDKNQVEAYEKLIHWHRTEIRKSDQQMLALKHDLYASLNQANVSPIKDSLINEIGKLQVKVETIHYKHFQDIKGLCKPEQLKYYESLTSEITELFPQTQNRPH